MNVYGFSRANTIHTSSTSALWDNRVSKCASLECRKSVIANRTENHHLLAYSRIYNKDERKKAMVELTELSLEFWKAQKFQQEPEISKIPFQILYASINTLEDRGAQAPLILAPADGFRGPLAPFGGLRPLLWGLQPLLEAYGLFQYHQ